MAERDNFFEDWTLGMEMLMEAMQFVPGAEDKWVGTYTESPELQKTWCLHLWYHGTVPMIRMELVQDPNNLELGRWERMAPVPEFEALAKQMNQLGKVPGREEEIDPNARGGCTHWLELPLGVDYRFFNGDLRDDALGKASRLANQLRKAAFPNIALYFSGPS